MNIEVESVISSLGQVTKTIDIDELIDFMECIANYRNPLSKFDIEYMATRIIYAAYLSAEENRIVYLK